MWNSKGKANFDIATVIILVVIGLVAWNSGLLGLGKPQAQVQVNGQQPADTVVKVVGAPCTQATTLTSSIVRRYTEVAQTTQNATILQNGVLLGTIAHGSTTTVQSGANGDELVIFPGLASTTFYPRKFKGKLTTCTGSATTGDPSFVEVDDVTPGGVKVKYSDETGLFAKSPNKLVQIDIAPTITVVNDGQADAQQGQVVNDGAAGFENLTIGSGGTGSVTVKFSPAANTGWGINGNILSCQFPSGTYDSQNPIAVNVVGQGALVTSDINPSTTLYPLYQANNTVKSFQFPGIDAKKTGDVIFTVKMTASSDDNPAGALDRINCSTADVSYYQKQSNGQYLLDVENRDTSADLGGNNAVYDFVIGVE